MYLDSHRNGSNLAVRGRFLYLYPLNPKFLANRAELSEVGGEGSFPVDMLCVLFLDALPGSTITHVIIDAAPELVPG